MKSYSVVEARKNFAQMCDDVVRDKVVALTRNGVPFACIIPMSSSGAVTFETIDELAVKFLENGSR